MVVRLIGQKIHPSGCIIYMEYYYDYKIMVSQYIAITIFTLFKQEVQLIMDGELIDKTCFIQLFSIVIMAS